MIKEKILNYLEATIQTKHNMRKRIYQLEAEVKEAHKNESYAIAQKDKYKEALKKYRRKLKDGSTNKKTRNR